MKVPVSDAPPTVSLMWNPWRVLSERKHIELKFERHLGAGTFGKSEFGPPPIISLLVGMTQAQRRSTLAHELVHLERGSIHDLNCELREEGAVDAEAARRLICWEDLVDAMYWCIDEHELAEHLWVDVPTVIARVRGLTDQETREINRRLDEAQLRHP